MNPTFDILVINKNEEKELEYAVYRYNAENLTGAVYDLQKVIDIILKSARDRKLEPTYLVFVPYTHIISEADGSANICFVRDIQNIKYIWAADGYSLSDTRCLELVKAECLFGRMDADELNDDDWQYPNYISDKPDEPD